MKSNTISQITVQGLSWEQGWIDVGNMSSRNIRFSLRNACGAVVPLHGAHMSIHLILDEALSLMPRPLPDP